MRMTRRIALAIGAFLVLAVAVFLGRWYDMKRAVPQPSTDNAVINVTNAADHGPGTLREALFIAAAATRGTTIVVKIANLSVDSALPPLVSSHGVTVQAQSPGARIDARALSGGPVFDIAGSNMSIEGLHIVNCPAAAVLVRAVRFRMESTSIESCDVGVDVAENASDTLITGNQFSKNRLAVRFAAAGKNSAVNQNNFSQDRDAGLWAVRGESGSRGDPLNVHDNHFSSEPTGIVAGNVPILVERNEFSNMHEAAVHLVGADAVVRGNRISGGESMGVVVENARGAVIDGNEIDGFKAYGIMVRGSANTLLRGNRLHNCGYGIAFVLGDSSAPSTAVENTIMEPKLNGIDVLGDSPILRRNKVLRPHGVSLHVEGFQPPGGQKVLAHPFLDNNTFGAGGADPAPVAGVTVGVEHRVSQ